ncbi:hypothetical protein PILCRDRAFT_17054 [Piloderma croceum F 1598]|uniref:Uncharacterized protein n=1 Tax=Piloderma croceum (strain F 1598) TaxID=765440 RepID=A0A0C3ACF6_PILCF|nr:hypothetical protein PILCRDRAFT_17054 [Piloderma croceum F 1598]
MLLATALPQGFSRPLLHLPRLGIYVKLSRGLLQRQASQDPGPSKRARKSSPFQDMMDRDVDIIDIISDDDIPTAGAVQKGKRKACTSNLGDIIELSD